MPSHRTWVLTLAVAALTPGVTHAGIGSLLKFGGGEKAQAVSKPGENQRMAEAIADALRKARLTGHDIEIEYRDGIAVLSGVVANKRQKTLATRVVSRLRGVKRVENRLAIGEAPSPATAAGAVLPESAAGNVVSAVHQPSAADGSGTIETVAAERLVPGSGAAAIKRSNQDIANSIAQALGRANLKGFNIEVRVKNGTAILGGTVSNAAQRELAAQVAASVPGVLHVENRISSPDMPPARPSLPGVQPAGWNAPGYPQAPSVIQPGNYQVAAPMPPVPGGAAPMPPNGQPVGPAHPGVAMGPGAGPSAGPAVYDMPHLPPYAWPAMAAYPNSAQISYPKDYSASAWPYIGPFYPYPQVPLGWRKVQLEWDDGYWSLNFNPRTDKWWWFLNPNNWGG